MEPSPFRRSGGQHLVQKSRRRWLLIVAALVSAAGAIPFARPVHADDEDKGKDTAEANATRNVDQGRRIFRFDTFGDEAFWGSTQLHQAIEGSKLGGIGPGISPST